MPTLLVAVLASQTLVASGLKVYRGRDGQRVEVVTLAVKKGATPNAVVRVTGSGSERDGLVFRGALADEGRAQTFTMRYGGRDWVLVRNEDGSAEVFMPGKRESFRAKYDDAATTAGDAQAVLKVHQAQLADDSVALAEKAEWPHLVAKYEKRALEAAAALGKRCGAQATVTLRWATFDDDTMANVDVWKLCAPAVQALEGACAMVKANPAVVCQLGAQPGAEKKDGVVRLTTTTKGLDAAFVMKELSR
ncbi:MAG: hypothetical protein JNJ54_27860 [Myxococcaceae bacterium]|nr:hypothetical protein [Myxococcaceae bacterium]